jgi:hypothetical protein
MAAECKLHTCHSAVREGFSDGNSTRLCRANCFLVKATPRLCAQADREKSTSPSARLRQHAVARADDGNGGSGSNFQLLDQRRRGN